MNHTSVILTTTEPRYVIGVMSGTSMDAVDVVLVRFSSEHSFHLLATHRHDYPASLRERLLRVDAHIALKEFAELDTLAAQEFAEAILALLAKISLPRQAIAGIGCHGQTVFHHPTLPVGNSIQIGNPAVVAHLTGIPVVADFRRSDIAAGGQGAPLVPAFHRQYMSAPYENRAILNIGGIANVTILPADPSAAVTGFDTGPGNCLLDGWIRYHRGLAYDAEGLWANSGTVCHDLLRQMLTHPFFMCSPPKSTGKDDFHLDWLFSQCAKLSAPVAPQDVQATLLELTAISITNALLAASPSISSLFICGGGVNNTALVKRICALIAPIATASTQHLGIDPLWVESAAFAWLARQRLLNRPGNLPGVTGASKEKILGAIYAA